MMIETRICLEEENHYYFNYLGIAYEVVNELIENELLDKSEPQRLTNRMIDISPEEQISNLPKAYAMSLGTKYKGQIFFDVARPAILINNQIYYIENETLSFSDLFNIFNTKNLTFLLIIDGNAGEFFRGEYPGYYFEVRSREHNHCTPHIHVDYKHQKSGSFKIEDGEMLNGNLTGKHKKLIRDVILEKQDILLKAWNLSQSGINMELNLALKNKVLRDKKL